MDYEGCKGCYWYEKGVCHSLLPKKEKPSCYDTKEDVKNRSKKIELATSSTGGKVE